MSTINNKGIRTVLESIKSSASIERIYASRLRSREEEQRPAKTLKNKRSKAILILILTCHLGLMAPQQSKASNLSDVQQLDRLYQELDEDCSNLEYESNECNLRQQEINELAKQLGPDLK